MGLTRIDDLHIDAFLARVLSALQGLQAQSGQSKKTVTKRTVYLRASAARELTISAQFARDYIDKDCEFLDQEWILFYMPDVLPFVFGASDVNLLKHQVVKTDSLISLNYEAMFLLRSFCSFGRYGECGVCHSRRKCIENHRSTGSGDCCMEAAAADDVFHITSVGGSSFVDTLEDAREFTPDTFMRQVLKDERDRLRNRRKHRAGKTGG